MSMSDLRVGDADRDRVNELLASHYAAGRIDRFELDHRTGVVLRSRTRRDLEEVLADLPPLAEPVAAPVRANAKAAGTQALRIWRVAVLAPWAMFGVFFVLIWLVTGAGYFWPVWPIMGWGLAVGASGMLAHTLPQEFLERRAARPPHLCARPRN